MKSERQSRAFLTPNLHHYILLKAFHTVKATDSCIREKQAPLWNTIYIREQ